MILILADAFDAHADSVERHLKELGTRHFRLNLDVDSLRFSHIHFNGSTWRIEQNGCRVDSGEISCVWPRALTVTLNLEQRNIKEENSFHLWRSEWNRCLYGMYSYLNDVFWMNSISKSSLSDNKFNQMRSARRHGFMIPDFISSNCPGELRDFARKYGEVALKFMSQEIYRGEDGVYSGIYVNRLTEKDLDAFGDVEENPVTLQRYINKSYEVRYTYVDGVHMVCRIDSQKSSRASVDWRRYDIANTPHSVINPPEEIKLKVKGFMESVGLTYGALDFIVDQRGGWWYLEVNSAGQWLWIEDLVALPISATIARSLANRAKGEIE